MSRPDVNAPAAMARLGNSFFQVIAVAQIATVLLAAPAATAGSFGVDRARGHISLMLMTEVTALDIVLGTLSARLLPVLGGVICVIPVLAVASNLGGIAPQALLVLVIITLASAVLGCSLALALSIGARRIHEVLVTTYALLAGWILGFPILSMIAQTSIGGLVPAWGMHWLLEINPVWLALAPAVQSRSLAADELAAFLGGTLGLSAVLVGFAAWLLRWFIVRDQAHVPRRLPAPLLTSFRGQSLLDNHPVYWRECRVPQRLPWVRVLWGLYVAGAVLFSLLAVGECLVRGVRMAFWASLFNGFQGAVGLLLLSLVAPASLAEERALGSLEVLLSTPLSTRSLVLGKWLAQYRVVPWIALLPGIVAVAHAQVHGRWLGVPLVIGMVLATGAALTSLGIALATWVPRLDRAVTLSAAAAVFVTVAWVPVAMLLSQPDARLGMGLASASPMFGVALLTSEMTRASPHDWPIRAGWATFWILVSSMLALVLLMATLATFDACLGRIRDRRS
jgi:hypothetical protein